MLFMFYKQDYKPDSSPNKILNRLSFQKNTNSTAITFNRITLPPCTVFLICPNKYKRKDHVR
ncbi:hypothetical protein HanXRQr2_Chr06g0257491 [Helianthus annuus]|uniref:Uncharacterized protein n=1 Tax=Helianthus annuus TaxID=4232 RepID=A0A9K3ISM4_HELAN|nr:hypothetical protein HanXRQr2_Chr06g0257491 [Helianthus annuus]KAJ0915320.1 hypothetical protein HanPSC8_Chr06g0248521 [Helianthus annuus]